MGVSNRSAELSIENTLWQAADKLRNNMDAAEYKHVVLGLLFLKYISDAFEEEYERLSQDEWADPEDPDEYLANNIFWVPKEARWSEIRKHAKKPEIGQVIDNAMIAIERENKSLKGVLPKNYARPELDKTRLGELVDLFSFKVGDKNGQDKDLLGRVYEYFLNKFAAAEGRNGGQFYTPRTVVRLLVEMIEPFKGRIYDPCCGSGGMFVQSEVYRGTSGQVRRCLHLRSGIQPDHLAALQDEPGHSRHRHQSGQTTCRHFPERPAPRPEGGLSSSPIPPFNICDWGGERLTEDVRWKYGIPPAEQRQLCLAAAHRLQAGPQRHGRDSSWPTAPCPPVRPMKREIRKTLIEADLVEAIVTLPGQLFYSTQIPVCVWVITKNKAARGQRNRKGEILFIDARKLGHMVDRTRRELSDEDIPKGRPHLPRLARTAGSG